MKWLDAYDLKARVLPAAVVGSPLMTLGAAACFSLFDVGAKSISSAAVIGLGVLYAFSQLVVRGAGADLEKQLWLDWDGAPSTRTVRWRDNTLGRDLKQRIHERVEQKFSVKLASEPDETANPDAADTVINDAFRQVRVLLRHKAPKGLWFVHNTEYGFLRNVLGSCRIWIILSGCSAFITGSVYGVTAQPLWAVACVMDLGLATTAFLLCRGPLRRLCKHAADRYAESAWVAFLSVTDNKSSSGEASHSSSATRNRKTKAAQT